MDKLIYGTAHNGDIRVIGVIDTDLVQHAKNIHNLSKTASAALGRTLTAGVLMGAMIKDDREVYTISIDGKGPLGKIIVTCKNGSKVKGYISNGDVELPPKANGKLDVGGGVGIDGEVLVIKDLGLKEPYIGRTPISTGEIGDDLAYYFTVSEGTPSAVGLGVLVNKDGSIKASGGFIIQMLPGADDLAADLLTYRLEEIPPITTLIEQGNTAEDMLGNIFEGMDLKILGEITPEYVCDCSREKVEKALISIGKKDLTEIYEEGKEEEVVCHFCNKKYKFSNSDIGDLLKRASK
ncbi:MAG: Hsp33 family molecular chaperone HslO [Bacillota bacterium]|nr:Hsp33 family molecular chaperone HslO [Bacillota bacterium]